MPIPILIAAAAGVLGLGGHLSAKETNEEAQRLSDDAQRLYNNSKHSLELAKSEVENALLEYGETKKNVLDTSMKRFLEAYDKVKHIQYDNSTVIDEYNNFDFEESDELELRKMIDIYSDVVKSGTTGATAGALVALAASGSLPIMVEGVSAAGGLLVAGDIGAAASVLGSTASFGLAMTPLAAIAAPVLLFTGIASSNKADENLEKARTMYAEAEAASEKMKTYEVMCTGLKDKIVLFNDLLVNLDVMFTDCTNILTGIIRKKEGIIFKKDITTQDFTENELSMIAITRSLAGAVKTVIHTPILSDSSDTITEEAENVYNYTVGQLPAYKKEVEIVKKNNAHIKAAKLSGPKEKENIKVSEPKPSGLMRIISIIWKMLIVLFSLIEIISGGELILSYRMYLAGVLLIISGAYAFGGRKLFESPKSAIKNMFIAFVFYMGYSFLI